MMKGKLLPLRWWDLPAALLLIAAILTSASRLVATEWTDHLAIVQTLVFFGVIAGWALGYSRFSPRTVVFLTFIYGLFAVPFQLGTTVPPDFSWLERMIILINRLQIIISQLVYREPVRDSLLFLVIMFALYWAISVHAGYALTRHGDGWMAILPGGLAMFVIHSFDQAVANRIWYLAAYLFFSLILISRMTFVHNQNQWRESRTALPPHLSLDFIRYTILAVFVIVTLSWTAPALAKALPQASRAWQPVRKAWTETVDDFENAFVSLKATVFSYTTVYSSTSSLGRGSELTDNQIFRARAPLSVPLGARLYWRARVYDSYENGQWRTTLDNSQPFNPLTGDLPVDPGIERWQGQFTVISAANFTTLLTPAQPLWVSRSGSLEYGSNPDGTIDIMTFSADPTIIPGQTYQILASLSNATTEQLRQSGTEYPAWIAERYLQLPDSITPRTVALAQQITAGLDNPYDKVIAVTRYLRESIQYVPFLEEGPPSNTEPVDWFLFESQTGFCNYYASAEVVLLRSLGIPARYSVGYSQGEMLDDSIEGLPADELSYIIRQRDAHAWPEVYFAGLGWVEFEPTVSQPEISRQETAEDDPLGNLTEAEELEALREDKRAQLELLRNQANQAAPAAPARNPSELLVRFAVLAAGMALLFYSLRFLPLFGLPTAPAILEALFLRAGVETPAPVRRWKQQADENPKFKPIQLPAFPILLERLITRLGLRTPQFIQRWARQAELPLLSKAYLEINRGLNLVGSPAVMTDTPYERAEKLGRLLPPADPPAKDLVSQYQVGTFSEQPVDLELAQLSASQIRKLTRKAFIAKFLKRFQKPEAPASPFSAGGKHTAN